MWAIIQRSKTDFYNAKMLGEKTVLGKVCNLKKYSLHQLFFIAKVPVEYTCLNIHYKIEMIAFVSLDEMANCSFSSYYPGASITSNPWILSDHYSCS